MLQMLVCVKVVYSKDSSLEGVTADSDKRWPAAVYSLL